MTNLNFIPTTEKVAIENYPYGFKLKTTLFDTIEFDPKKGYRRVSQTVNPKTGVLNKPKKGTYYPFILRYKNEDGHIKGLHIDFNKVFAEMNIVANRISEVWEHLGTNEKEYVIRTYKRYLIIGCIAAIKYAGTDENVIMPEFKKLTGYLDSFANFEEKKVKGVIKNVTFSYNVEVNLWLDMPLINAEAIKKATPEGYSPFKQVN